MHDDGSRDIVEGVPGDTLQPGLQAEVAVPHGALDERVDEGDDQQRGEQLR